MNDYVLHLRGLNLVDVETLTVTEGASLTVRSGRIESIGSDPPAGSLDLDLSGCWAVPALVDLHAHVTFDARSHHGTSRFDYAEDSWLAAARSVQNLTEAARVGIGLVRDVGARSAAISQVREMVNSGQLLGPELVTSGPPLCLPNGHGFAFGQVAPARQELAERLRQHRADGHEWLKIMNGPETWPAGELAEIVRAARRADLRVAVHAFTPEGIRDAVLAGAHTVEHALVADPDLVAQARRLATVFVPTYYCSWLSLRPRFLRTQPAHEIALLQQWRTYLAKCQPGHLASDLPVAVGTDAGCAPCSFDDYVEELVQFRSWGVAAERVLRCATLDGARVLGRAADHGSITVGKWASFLVLDRSPLPDLRALSEPVLIMLKGVDVLNRLGQRWS